MASTAKNPAPQADALTTALAAVLAPMIREAVAEALAEHRAGEPPKPELMQVADICAALSISRATLHRLRGEGMPELRVGDSPRFRLADCIGWLESRGRIEP